MNNIYATINEVKQLENGQTYVTIKLPNGTILQGEPADLGNEVSVADITYKVFKLNDTSKAFLVAKNEMSALVGGPTNFIASHDKYGNIISGPTSFTAHPEQIKFNNTYRFNGQLTSGLPSTIVTPIPVFIVDLPGINFIKTLQSLVSQFESILL